MKHGFSLVELSIVLVILGLLVGGILAGQSLIRASELRAVTVEYQRYITATHGFRDKYFAIPGDFREATKFWGRLNGNADCVTNSGALVATPGACDGEGNGRNYEGTSAANSAQERFQVWRHLALAGLIEGTYTGLSGSTAAAGTSANIPRSKLGTSLWWTQYLGNYGGSSAHYALDYGNYFSLGNPASGSDPYLPNLKPEEAWNIDTKLDDGKPARGKVIAGFWNDLCSNVDSGGLANTNLNASYKLSDNSIQCLLYFVRQY